MKDKKKLLIGILSVLVCIMAVGYALLAQELTINGRASIDSTWKVEITNITSKDVVGDAVNKETPTYTATTANFSVGFTQPGDSITYDIEITNKGTLDAVVESITVNKDDNPAIKYTTNGLEQGDKISKNNGTNTLTVKVDYDSSVISQPVSTTNDITVTINYQQDLGQFNSVAYSAYSIGDTINFAGSSWRVIKASTIEEDYVTLLKENILTNEELEDYAFRSGYDTMAYYFDADKCQLKERYFTGGWYYSTSPDCINSYSSSIIKTFLEGTYANTIGSNNLKEIDGYKIRLITKSEIESMCDSTPPDTSGNIYVDLNTAPSFVFSNFGSTSSYWTMTQYNDTPDRVLYVIKSAYGNSNNISAELGQVNYGGIHGVRPVINLLKSVIQ